MKCVRKTTIVKEKNTLSYFLPHYCTFHGLWKNHLCTTYTAFQKSPVFFFHAVSFILTISKTYLCPSQFYLISRSVSTVPQFSHRLQERKTPFLQMKDPRSTDIDRLMPYELLVTELDLRVYTCTLASPLPAVINSYSICNTIHLVIFMTL